MIADVTRGNASYESKRVYSSLLPEAEGARGAGADYVLIEPFYYNFMNRLLYLNVSKMLFAFLDI